MTDIVERLRKLETQEDRRHLCLEASDEIMRLRELLRQFGDVWRAGMVFGTPEEVARYARAAELTPVTPTCAVCGNPRNGEGHISCDLVAKQSL
jgi:hypothetical protein